MQRAAKQMIYGIVYFIVFVFVLYIIYARFFAPPASCYDKKQNQDETGIDCGGVCGTICLPATLENLQVVGGVNLVSLGEDSISGHRVSAVVELRNPNAQAAVSNFVYTINFYDPSGLLIKSRTEESFIYAQEVKHIALPNIRFDSSPQRAEFILEETSWIHASVFSKPPITLRSVRSVLLADDVVTQGSVVNGDTITLSEVLLTARFFTRDGLLGGVSITELENIAPQESRTFRILHPNLENIDPSQTQVFATSIRK